MNEILITGAHGFIGTNAARYFAEKGLKVDSLDIRTQESPHYNQQFLWGNTLPSKAYDAVIHLAGKAHDTSTNPDPQPYFKINRDLTIQIFDHFLKSESKIFIMFSTAAAVADSLPKGFVLTEENYTATPSTPYGVSKFEAEQYILSKTIPEGKSVYILRPTMVYGVGAPGNLSLLVGMLRRGIPYPFGKLDNYRTFVALGNLLFVLSDLIVKKPKSNTFFVADDQPLSTIELINLMGKVLGKKPKIWNTPLWLVRTMVTVGDILHLPINKQRFSKMTGDFIVSNQRLLDALGLKELPFKAKETMFNTLKSFKK